MNASPQSILNSAAPARNRYILVQISDQTLAILSDWVAEILRVDKLKILNLPFYENLMLGVTHHNGQVLPLISTHLLLGLSFGELPEISTVVRLSVVVDDVVVEVGLAVDRVLGSVIQPQLSGATVIFNPQMLQSHLWRPLN